MKKTIFSRILLLLLVVCGAMGCGQGDNETGSVIINLLEADAESNKKSLTSKAPLSIDCEEVSTVEVDIYDEDGTRLKGGSFLCSSRTGNVDKIPVGSNRTCIVSAKKNNGNVVYRGTENDITIQEGANTINVEMMRVDETETSVTISSPEGGAEYIIGDDITLIGSAIDALDGTLAGDALVWAITQNDQILTIGTGTPLTFSTTDFIAGTYKVTLTATAQDNTFAEGSINILLKQNTDPKVILSTSPSSDNGEYIAGTVMTFTGTVTDPDETIPVDNYIWTVDSVEYRRGENSITLNDLSIGQHAITLTVTDSHGGTNSDTVIIQIEQNNDPVVTLSVSPSSDSGEYIEGTAITFTGAVTDLDETIPVDNYVWTDGFVELESGVNSITPNGLSVGQHTITLTVTDSHGAVSSYSVDVTIKSNELPVASISQPHGGAFLGGDVIVFSGSGKDAEDGILEDDQLEWESSIDGIIGTGSELTKSDLSIGDHIITLIVTDNDGGANTDIIRITISTLMVFNNSIGMDLNIIPAGTFTMGSPEDELGRNWDETQHQVTLTRSFYIQTTEVTQKQWKDIMGEGTNPSFFQGCGDDCPVEQITWYDAVIFSNRLSEQEGLIPSYYADDSHTIVFTGSPPVKYGVVYWNPEANGYRLPTEAEWEYAARAESTTAFANGLISELECGYDPNLDVMGWYCGNNGAIGTGTKPVAHEDKIANDWGLFDMHGNVYEWCWDWYRANLSGPVTDPHGDLTGNSRAFVIRGGSWGSPAWRCRAARREQYGTDAVTSNVGFRLVLPSGQ